MICRIFNIPQLTREFFANNTLTISDGTTALATLQMAGPYTSSSFVLSNDNNGTAIVAAGSLHPLTISGTIASQAVAAGFSILPFTNATIGDPNAGQSETLTVTLSAAANGTLTNLAGGSYNAATGLYTVTGTASQVTAALDGLVFVSTIIQGPPGQTVTTTFTIQDSDTAGLSVTDSTSNVIAATVAPPTITGIGVGQITTDQAGIAPFAGVTITDPNAGQTETVTVTLSAAANGTLTNLGGGSYNAETGVYTDHRHRRGGDGGAGWAGVHADCPSGGAGPDGHHHLHDPRTPTRRAPARPTARRPWSLPPSPARRRSAAPWRARQRRIGQRLRRSRSVTIADPNAGQTETVTVTLSAAASGSLTNLGGGSYNANTGVYTVTGTAAAVTAALDGLRVHIDALQAPAGQTVTTGFTISVTDTAGRRRQRQHGQRHHYRDQQQRTDWCPQCPICSLS